MVGRVSLEFSPFTSVPDVDVGCLIELMGSSPLYSQGEFREGLAKALPHSALSIFPIHILGRSGGVLLPLVPSGHGTYAELYLL